MNEPIGMSVTLGKCEFYTRECAWNRISVKVYFEQSDTKLFESRFVLPARFANIAVDMINRRILNERHGIENFYQFMADYSLFELVLNKKL